MEKCVTVIKRRRIVSNNYVPPPVERKNKNADIFYVETEGMPIQYAETSSDVDAMSETSEKSISEYTDEEIRFWAIENAYKELKNGGKTFDQVVSAFEGILDDMDNIIAKFKEGYFERYFR